LAAYAPDAILFLGTALGEMSTSGWSALLGAPSLRLHVDIDCTKFNRAYRMSAAIDNDVQAVLEDMLQRHPVRGDFPGSARTSLILPRYRANASNQGVHPGLMFKGLSERLPSNTAIFADIGNSIAWAFRDLALRGEQMLIVALGLSAMGSAIGAAVGASTVWRQRTVLCICGDCAALMHGSELKTAAEYQLPLKVVVLNDGGPGMVHHGSRLIGLKHSRVRFSQRVDFEAYARAFGLPAFSVRSSDEWDEPWLERLLAEPGPALLDVWVDPAIEPPIGDRARVLGQSESARRG
ncbi:MAG TPA: thiamine pyrophosphate-dependent enzyme, partial [Polyangiaceae bacterium]